MTVIREHSDYKHYVKIVRIRSFSGPHFPAFGLNTERYGLSYSVWMRENTDQKNSEYGHFSHFSRCENVALNAFSHNIFQKGIWKLFLVIRKNKKYTLSKKLFFELIYQIPNIARRQFTILRKTFFFNINRVSAKHDSEDASVVSLENVQELSFNSRF